MSNKPSVTLPGTVDRLVRSPFPNEPDKAQIAVNGGDELYRELRIPTGLKNENGGDVDLKLGGHVEPTIETCAKDTIVKVLDVPFPIPTTVRILLVDDQRMILKRVQSILEEEPTFEICGEAYDGEKAILEAVRLEPDVVVLNVSMPIMDGFSAARVIRVRLPKTAIVILSSEADKHFVEEARKIGARAYVVKTKASNALIKAIKAAVTGGGFVVVN
jgi:CheY-like chemotaxis protein